MLSLGLAQSVHSVFYPLNLQPQPLSLPLSNWTYVFSLVLCLAWRSIYPLPAFPSISLCLLSSCLSPLTSFFLSFSKYSFFLSLQTPDSWGRSKPNSWGKQRTEKVRWQCCSMGNGFWRGIKTAHLKKIKSWIKPPPSLYWCVAVFCIILKTKLLKLK